MGRILRFFAVFSLVLGGVVFSAYAEYDAPQPALPIVEARIATTSGKPVNLRLELAQTPEQYERGLMFRTDIAEDSGMLFLYGDDGQTHYMWMKNTLIPLDIIYLDVAGMVIHIERDTVPQSLEPLGTPLPSAAVVEVRGGVTRLWGVEKGDRFAFPLEIQLRLQEKKP